MYGAYEKDTVENYAKDVIKDYLSTEEGSSIYAPDFVANVSNYANADGCVFIYDQDAQSFINDNYEQAKEAYDYAKFNYGMDINPFDNPHQVVAIMIDAAVERLAEKSDILHTDGYVDLNMSTCDRIMNEMGIDYDAGERFEHIGNDTVQFVHEWQDALIENGADAFADHSPICSPIIKEGEIIGQDIRISETPAVWLDTSENVFCVYQAGELAMFDADPVACEELTDIAVDEYADLSDEARNEFKDSTLDTAMKSLDHYFNEGSYETVERELDTELEFCEEKAEAANDGLESKEMDEAVR